MKNKKWTYKNYTTSLGETGDYSDHVEFTNGDDILITNADDISDAELEEFCYLLNLMPDLWSVKCDGTEFELSQLRKEFDEYKSSTNSLTTKRLFKVDCRFNVLDYSYSEITMVVANSESEAKNKVIQYFKNDIPDIEINSIMEQPNLLIL